MSGPLVSVIILNFNGKNHLINCLKSVLSNNYPNYEVILLDNNSVDSSIEKAEALFGADKHLNIVKSKQNLGFAGGNNFAFRYSKGELIAFLNNDTLVETNWLTALVNAMKNDPTIGLSQSLILNMNDGTIQNAGWIFHSFLVSKYPLLSDKPGNIELKTIYEISFACGASMIARREIIEEFGLFEISMPFFYDDTLISLKTWLSNKRVVTVSNSRIRHMGGATNVWKTKFTTYHLAKSNICLLFDCYPKLNDLAKSVFIYASNVAVNSIFCIKNKNVDAVLGHIQAFKWFFKNFSYIWQNKLNHWSKSKVSPKTLEKNFFRLQLPIPFYLFPSKLGFSHNNFQVYSYEKIVKGNQSN